MSGRAPGQAESDEPLYFDHNGTTPVAPEVFEAMRPYLQRAFGNPSSSHAYGRRAREAVEDARRRVAALIGAAPDEIVFTSGGTEASNLAILGVLGRAGSASHVVTSAVEHPATAEPCALLERRGTTVTRIGVDRDGVLRVDEAVTALRDDTALVTLIHAHNETGTVQPVADVARAARERGVPVHADAAQSVGKIPVDVEALGVDLLTIAGHKLYAPKGIGALYVRRGTALDPPVRGAGQERGLRPGTENVAGIVALGEACRIAAERLAGEAARQRALTEGLWDRLRAGIDGIVRFGHAERRLPNTLFVGFPGASGATVLAAAPSVAASTGSACHAGTDHPSAVLAAMGVPAELARGAVRLSIGRATGAEDVDRAADALSAAWRALR